MYDRAQRTISKPCGSTAPGVGPGTYNPQDRTKAKDSYAPFQSMAVRESFLTVNDSLAAAPGPGHYSLNSGSSLGSDRGRGALHNKAERFHSPSSKTPGPGAYTISKRSDWIRKTYPPPQSAGVHQTASFHNKDVLRVGHVTFHRQQTAPSIPMPGQNYGYEEEEDGTLKPQALPVNDSSMGPAYYNVTDTDTEAAQKYRGVHFGNLKSQRTLFKGIQGPGPGDYEPGRSIKNKSGNSRSSVLSNLPRYHELVTKLEEKKAVPGPGQYQIKSQFEKVTALEEEDEEDSVDPGTKKAPFGSSLQRFLLPKNNSPACTTYQDPRTAFESSQRLSGMRKAPFGQTSTRFRDSRHAKFLPGPGAYNNSNVTSMATELTKKSIMSQTHGIHHCPFGTTSVRTAPLIKKDELHMPGPAHYQRDPSSKETDPESTPVPISKPQKPKKSFMFTSTSKRLYSPPTIVTEIPPPGSYEVSDSYKKSQGRLDVNARVINSTFLSTSERFAPPRDILLEEPDTTNPGPGEYDSPGLLGLGKGGLLCGKDLRFKDHSSAVPGPGAYQMSEAQRNTLLKGTFNVSLDNPLSPQEQNKLHTSSSRKQAAFVLGV